METGTADERLRALEAWRAQLERNRELTKVIEFVEQLMDEADYRARNRSNRDQSLRRRKLQLAIFAGAVAVAATIFQSVLTIARLVVHA